MRGNPEVEHRIITELKHCVRSEIARSSKYQHSISSQAAFGRLRIQSSKHGAQRDRAE